MKKLVTLLALLVALDFAAKFVELPRVQAQNATPYWFSANGLHTACVAATGTGISTFCYAGDGQWESDNGGAWYRIGGGVQAGVTSFNGRTGAVTAQNGDYAYAQITGTPPPSGVASFNGRVGAVVAIPNDYSYSMLQGTPPQKPSFGCAQVSLNNSANPPFVAGGCQ